MNKNALKIASFWFSGSFFDHCYIRIADGVIVFIGGYSFNDNQYSKLTSWQFACCESFA